MKVQTMERMVFPQRWGCAAGAIRAQVNRWPPVRVTLPECLPARLRTPL